MRKKTAAGKVLVCLLALLMVLSAIPVQTYAYLGMGRGKATNVMSGTYEDEYSRKLAYLQNDYLSFHIVVEADSSAYEGSEFYTIPTADFTNITNMAKYGTQQVAFRVDEQMKLVKVDHAKYPEEPNDYIYEPVISQPFLLTVKDVTYSINKSAGTITINYVFTDSSYSAQSVYSLIRYYRGMTGDSASAYFETDEEFSASIKKDTDDKTQTWGVLCETKFTCTKKDHFTDFSVLNSYVDYPKMGHPTADGKACVYLNQVNNTNIPYGTEEPSSPRSFLNLDVTGGMGATKLQVNRYHTFSEFYVDGYPWANPFVVVDDFNRFIPHHYGANTEDYYMFATAASYKNKTLTTQVGAYSFSNSFEGNEIVSGYVANLWGYRDLKNADELPNITKPDTVVVPETAQYLAVVKHGNGYKVVPVATKAEADKLTGLVAALRGNYYYDTVNKRFVFNKGVELSPSITASWNTGTGVFLDENGTLHIDQQNVSLNTPTFKFYEPKNGGYLDLSYSDNGIHIGLNHGKNDAIVSLNIPNAICKLSDADIDTKGNLIFAGEFGIQSLFDNATFTMDKLSYGLSNGDMKVNGIHCAGSLNVSEASLLGHGAGKIEGEINTFNGEELYKFSLELEVGDLFSAEANLELVRLNNGRLCPEDLYLFVKTEVDGAGIDITPGTPVVTLTGGGGGISGLASTINGNYNAIPPVVLTLAVSGEVIKVVEGDLKLEAGPTKLRLSASDIGIKVGNKKLKIIDEMSAGLFAEEKDLTYKNDKYSGYYFGGDASLGIKVFNIKEGEEFYNTLGWFNGTVEAGFGVGVYGFVGENKSVKKVMAELGILGNASAALRIPERIPVVGGTKLLGAALNFKLSGTSVMPTNNQTISSLFKNMEVTGGLVATGSIIGISGRVIYLIPDQISVKGKLWNEFEEWDWGDDEELPTNVAKTKLLTSPILTCTEDGQDALVLATFKGAPVNVDSTDPLGAAPGGNTDKVVVPQLEKLADDEYLILAIIPKDQENIESFRESLVINTASDYAGNEIISPLTLKLYNNNASTPEENNDANAYVGNFKVDENTGEVTSKAVFVSLPKSALSGVGSFKVSANGDFDTSAAVTLPLTGLSADVTGSEQKTLSASVTAPETGANYLLYTYYAKEKDGSDYLVDIREINNATDFELPASGLIAPSGSYFVTSFLTQETMITNSEGQSELFEIPIASYSSQTAVMDYSYVTAVSAPTDVELVLSGNEVMTASWKGNGEDISGYIVNIYQDNGTGEYVDTNRGYRQPLENFKESGAVRFDQSTNTYSIEMAMTAGGETALEADKNYKVGVVAYKDTELAGVQCPSYSSEILSEGKNLPKYEPVVIKVSENNIGYLTKNSDNMFECITGSNGTTLVISSDKSDNVTYFVTRMDNNESVTVSPYIDDTYSFDLPDFDGRVIFEIRAAYAHGGVVDDTYEYVVVSKDEVAPVITLESSFFTADTDGNFVIKGVAGVGDSIQAGSGGYMNSISGLWIYDDNYSATADNKGSFTITGNLGDKEGITVTMQAVDSRNNTSEKVSAYVSAVSEVIEIAEMPELPDPKVLENPNWPQNPERPKEPEGPVTPVVPNEPVVPIETVKNNTTKTPEKPKKSETTTEEDTEDTLPKEEEPIEEVEEEKVDVVLQPETDDTTKPKDNDKPEKADSTPAEETPDTIIKESEEKKESNIPVVPLAVGGGVVVAGSGTALGLAIRKRRILRGFKK